MTKIILAVLLFSAANVSAAVPTWSNIPSTGTGTSTTYLSGTMKVYVSTKSAAAVPAVTIDGPSTRIVVGSGLNTSTISGTGFYGNGATLSNIPSTTQVNAIAASTGSIYGLFTDIKDPTGFFETTSSSLSLSGRVFTINGTNFPVYINGVKFLKSTATVTVPDLTQTNFIYYDLSGNLTQATSFPGFYYPLVATVYYSTDSVVSLLSDERHTAVMDWKTHAYLHQTVGARYASGLAGTFDVNYATITSGSYFDEDIQQDIPETTRFTVLYKNGPSYFQILASTSAYYKQNAGILQYNNGNALTNVGIGEYVAYWLFASSDVRDKIWVVTGQRVDSSLANARLNNTYETLSLTGFPSSEVKLLYRVILHRAVGTGISTYDEAADYRTVSTLPGSNYTPTSHSSLSNLSLTAAGHPYDSAGGFASFDATVQKAGSTMTGQLTVSGSSITTTGTNSAIRIKSGGDYLGLTIERNANDSVLSQYYYGGAWNIDSTYGSTGAYLPLKLRTQNRDSVIIAAGDNNVTFLSTVTVQGNAFSVGGSTLSCSSGKCGIGTSSPDRQLSILGIANSYSIFKVGDGTRYLDLKTFSPNGGGIQISRSGSDIINISGGIGIGDAYSGLATPTNGLAVSGSVGIGTISPDQKLTVAGNISLTGVIYSSGTAVSKFGGPIEASSYILGARGAGSTPGISDLYGTSGYYGFRTATGNHFALDTYNGSAYQESLRVLKTGEVGIGTPSPSARLHIIGNAIISSNTALTTYTETKSSATVATSYDVSWSSGSVYWLSLNDNVTLTFSGAVDGQTLTLFVKQNVGSKSITWPTISWPSATAPTLTTAAGKIDIITLTYIGGVYYGFIGGQNY